MVRGLLASAVLGLAASVGAQPISISEIALNPNSGPVAIVRGPDGNVWFNERQANKIGMIPSGGGTLSEFPVPVITAGSLTLRTMSIAAPGDGDTLWYLASEGGDGAVCKITTGGAAEQVSAVVPSRLFGLTVRSDGIWFTGVANNVLTIRKMSLDPPNAITEYPVPTPNGFAATTNGIITGPDGNLWFTEPGANKIGKITPSGTITEYALAAGSGPIGIASAGGELWFTEPGTNKIGRMTTSGSLVNEYTVTAGTAVVQDITLGPNGALWFTESSPAANKIGSITTSGQITESNPVPTASSIPFGIASVGGDVWFTETTGSKIGRVSGISSGPPPTPTPTPPPTPTPTPGNGPVLQISKADDGRAWIDSQGTVNYTIAYSNTGNATAHGVRLIEQPDPQENFYGGGGFDSSGVMEIGDLAPGTSGSVSLSMGVALNLDDPESQPYEIHNEVEIQADAPGSSTPGAVSAVSKLGPGFIGGSASSITPACTNGIACICPLRQFLGSLETQFKRATTLVKSAAQDILLYYRVRDRVLAQSPGGKRYIALYYRHASEITGLFAGDASLRSLSLAAMDAWGPGLEALVEGQGSGSPVTQEMADSMTAMLEKLKQEGSPDLRSDIQQEQAALNLASLVGQPMDQASRKVDQRPCVASDGNLCLNNGRFRVDVTWRVPEQAKSGVGTAKALTGDTGYFWFFNSANVELVVKVLDATGVNHHFWVFYGALSDVAYTITVTDTQTGVVRTYSNPDHHLASFADTSAFASESSPTLKKRSESGATGREVEKLSASELGALFGALTQAPAAVSEKAAAAPCAAGGPKLCLGGGRFEVTVDWSVPSQGKSGTGTAVPVSDDTGYMWFFSNANVELIIKVLDGRSITGHFWVFYGALSDVQYTITVKDTQTNAVRTYENPSGHQASSADTNAF